MKSIPTKISGDNIYIENNDDQNEKDYELKNKKCKDCSLLDIRITDEKRKMPFKGLSDLSKINKYDLYILYIFAKHIEIDF